MLHLLETKDTRYNPRCGEGGGRGGENYFELGAVLIYGSTTWAVLGPTLFVLLGGACTAAKLSVLSYTGLLFGPVLCLHCEIPPPVPFCTMWTSACCSGLCEGCSEGQSQFH